MPIDPGKLNKKITIQRLGTGQSAMGAPLESWSTLTTAWAERRDRKGRQSWENEGAGKVEAVMFTDWRIYRSSDTDNLSSADRISFNSRVFDILTIRDIGEDVIELTTRLRTNAPIAVAVSATELSTDFSVDGNLTIKAAAGF